MVAISVAADTVEAAVRLGFRPVPFTRRSTMGPMADASPDLRAAVLLYPGCTVAETIGLATRLADLGVEVTNVGSAVGPIRDRSGLSMNPDAAIGELDPATIDLLVVPGGDPEAIIDDDRVLGFVASTAVDGAIVAGICAGVLVMAAAGLTAGRAITHNYRWPWAGPEIAEFVDRFWTDAAVEPDPAVGVVVDGPIITALPNATIEFAVTVCVWLGLFGADEAERLARHLRGQLVAELDGRD